MRTARLLGEGRSFYHVMSRVVDRRMVFKSKDKEVFRKILRNQETFTGVRVVTYCLMSNHFHLLLEVPAREALAPLDEDGLLAVLPLLHDAVSVEFKGQTIRTNLRDRQSVRFRLPKLPSHRIIIK